MAISDRIVVMREGRIEQEGAPLEIYDQPRTRFVADFIGAANILAGELKADGDGRLALFESGGATIRCQLRTEPTRPAADGRHLLAVRTVYPELWREPERGLDNVWPATITKRLLLGDIVDYTVSWPGGDLKVRGFPQDLFAEGEQTYLHIPAEKAVPVEADAEVEA